MLLTILWTEPYIFVSWNSDAPVLNGRKLFLKRRYPRLHNYKLCNSKFKRLSDSSSSFFSSRAARHPGGNSPFLHLNCGKYHLGKIKRKPPPTSLWTGVQLQQGNGEIYIKNRLFRKSESGQTIRRFSIPVN